MLLFGLREPVNALSHGVGMTLALPVTWILWTRCRKLCVGERLHPECDSSRYQGIKALCLLIFGLSLTLCYGISALFHGLPLEGEALHRLQRLDHVGIYLLIAGTYTPVAWALMRGSWLWGTLATVWTVAISCSSRVWCGGVMPMWISTLMYLTMGWGALFCYFELAKTYSHGTLLPLPAGGVFYSVGAVLNLLRWPVLLPGVFAAHELLHFFVIAGSACHVFFMVKVVVPSPSPTLLTVRLTAPVPAHEPRLAGALERGTRWLPHLPGHRRPADDALSVCTQVRIGDQRDALPPDNAIRVA